MKLLHYVDRRPHAKNDQALPRMCAVGQVEYEETTDPTRLLTPDYDILVSCTTFLNPQHIPPHVQIVFGPHFSVFPEGALVGPLNPEWARRCVYNCLSEWNRNVFREMAPTTMPLVCLPFGVDLGTFAPTGEPKEWDCLVYVKRRPTELVQHVLEILAAQQVKWRMFQYGSYKEEDYRAALCRAKWMLVLDAHESQGFALQEAMACNVPLLVLDATSMYDETEGGRSTYAHLKPRRLAATSVPYWSEECGIRCENVLEVGEVVETMQKEWTRFTPREYIRRTLSYEACMRRLLDALDVKK